MIEYLIATCSHQAGTSIALMRSEEYHDKEKPHNSKPEYDEKYDYENDEDMEYSTEHFHPNVRIIAGILQVDGNKTR